MKDLYRKIADVICDVPNMNREYFTGILTPLENEEQAIKFLEYVKENRDDEYKMRPDRLIHKVLILTNKYPKEFIDEYEF